MGAHVRGYDPVAMPGAARVWPELELAPDAYAAARGADAVAVLTEWPQFLALQLDRLRDEMRGRWFFDLRNVFDPARVRGQGLRYEGVGRGARPAGVPAGGPPVSLTAP
jgi:UDPglucose 6-dehydrogenase